MDSTTGQHLPAAPAPRITWTTRRKVVVGIVVGVVLMAIGGAMASPTTTPAAKAGRAAAVAPTDAPALEQPAADVNAADVVAAMPAAKVRAFCVAWAQVGDFDKAQRQFTKGYGHPANMPGPAAVFAELVVSC